MVLLGRAEFEFKPATQGPHAGTAAGGFLVPPAAPHCPLGVVGHGGNTATSDMRLLHSEGELKRHRPLEPQAGLN